MSTHPNTILTAVLTPDDLPKKTMRLISDFWNADEDTETINISG